MIGDLDRDVIERFLATPVSRVSLVLSQIVRSALTALIQAIVILLVALAARRARARAARPAGWSCSLAAMLVNSAFAGHLAGARAADAQGGDDDRDRQLHRPAALLPLVDADLAASRCRSGCRS